MVKLVDRETGEKYFDDRDRVYGLADDGSLWLWHGKARGWGLLTLCLPQDNNDHEPEYNGG